MEYIEDSPANRTDRNWRRKTRSLAVIAACLGVVLWASLFRLDKGWLFPIRVGSGSMAPALLGPALHVVCEECRFAFAFDALPKAATDYICPNCGDVGQAALSGVRPGQRVTLRRITTPRRFDVVAVGEPGSEEGALITKRIVGLPGESVRIEAGDLFIDDRMVCKSPQRLKEVAVVVHDDRYRVESGEPPSRWRAGSMQTTDSGWLATIDGYRWRGSDQESTSVSWLTYHHAASYSAASVREAPSRLMDHCPYNQHASRVLNRTSDCHLSVAVRHTGDGHIYFRRHGSGCNWTVELDTATGAATLQESRHASDKSAEVLFEFHAPAVDPGLKSGTSPPTNAYLFGYWDGHFHLVCNGRQFLKYELPVQPALAGVDQLFSLAARGMDSLDLKNLVVARDIYYTDAYGTNLPWALGRILQRDEFLLLGDNSSISKDARHAEPLGVVTSTNIVGRVIPAREK